MKINSQTQQKKKTYVKEEETSLIKKTHTHTLFLNENER